MTRREHGSGEAPLVTASDAAAQRSIARFYPIVDSAAWVARLVACGARLIQLRIKDRDEAHVRDDVRAARETCRGRTILVVNDYWRIAIDEGCELVHLGQGDVEHADVPAIRKAGIRLGISTHDHAELERALALAPDYVALGPIYPTALKEMPWPAQGLGRIAEWKRLIGAVPLVAIGGLNPERARAALAAGADSAAVVTDIVRNPRPEARAREWLATLEPGLEDSVDATRAAQR